MRERRIEDHSIVCRSIGAPEVNVRCDIYIVQQPVMLRVRCRPAQLATSELAGHFPLHPGTVSGVDYTALFVGPEEWLLVGHGTDSDSLRARCETLLQGTVYLIADTHGSIACLRFRGDAAEQVLGSGCSLDLRADAFPVGHSSAARFGHARVLMHAVEDDGKCWDLYVDRSYMDYIIGLCNACNVTSRRRS